MICSTCDRILYKWDFSSTQKKKKKIRRCLWCIYTNSEYQQLSSIETNKLLFKWLKNQKAIIGPVFLDTKYGYRGLFCNKTIIKKSTLIEIPLSCMINNFTLPDEIPVILEDQTRIALFILKESKNKQSYWYDYINTLPKDLSHHPLFWGPKYFSQCVTGLIPDMIQARMSILKDEYIRIKKLSLDIDMNFIDFVWAKTIVVSRVFSSVINGKKTASIVPLIDMCNHSINPTTSWNFDNSKNTFQLHTTKPLLKNSEITDSYGLKCNSRFFVSYGFVLEENTENTTIIQIKPDLIGDCQANILKKFLLGKTYCYDEGFCNYTYLVQNKLEKEKYKDGYYRFQIRKLENLEQHYIDGSKYTINQCTRSMFSFLRIMVATESELVYIYEQLKEKLPIDKNNIYRIIPMIIDLKPVSISNELNVLKYLYRLTTSMLDDYSYNDFINEEMKSKSVYTRYSKKHTISVLRIGEMKILFWLRDLCNNVISIWDEYENVHKVHRLLNKQPNTSNYINLYWYCLCK